MNWGLFRSRARWFVRRRRWAGLARSVWWLLTGMDSEDCEECGRRMGVIWFAPGPLWLELHGSYSGILCIRCFDRTADRADIRLRWTPIVTGRGGISTTNYWHDATRDRLLMGEPDPGFHEGGKVRDPQGPWGQIAEALDWTWKSVYPKENRLDRGVR